MAKLRLAITLVFVTCLAACGASQVIVSPILDLPTPLVEPIPVDIGIYYSQSFRNFVYDESKDSQGVDDTSIHLGNAQISMFDRVFAAYFSGVQILERGEPASKRAGLDAVLVPQVADVEYSVPRTSKAKIYEVWIKYQFDLLAPDGTTIAKWTMPVYGKTPTALLKSNSEAINLAAMMALRDSGAAFITGFSKVPEVAQWLDRSISGAPGPNQPDHGEVNNE